jgi:hypothetical protein
MTVALRRLMKEQHKAMFLTLRAGEFDTEIDRIFGEPGMLTSEQPRADSTLSLPALVSQPAPGSTRSDGLESPRGELSEPSLPASSSESVPRGPHAQEPPRPNSSPGSAPGSLQAALAHAAGGGHSAERDDGPAKHRHESDAEPQSRGVSPEGTRRAAIFGSGVIRPSPSIFDESPGTEDSLGDAILSFLAEDTDRDT